MSIADEQRVSASGATTAQSASQPDAYSPQVIRKLNDLTSDFYAREAASFSATRPSPLAWLGEGLGAHHGPRCRARPLSQPRRRARLPLQPRRPHPR